MFGLLNITVSHGQVKIKTDINSKGDTLYSTVEKKLYTSPGGKNTIGEILKSSIYKTAAGFSLCLSLQTGRTNVFTISENDAAEIYLKDGSIISLRSSGDYNSRRSALDYGCYLFAFYLLDGRSINQLRSQDLKKLTVFASSGKMFYDIKDKQADIIREQLMSFK